MLTEREKNQKLIELQLGDLSDANMVILASHINSLIAGQNYKEKIEAQIEEQKLRETYDMKSFVEGKIVVERVPYIKTPCKKRRPRIVSLSNNIELNITAINQRDDEMISKHMENLRDLFSQELR